MEENVKKTASSSEKEQLKENLKAAKPNMPFTSTG